MHELPSRHIIHRQRGHINSDLNKMFGLPRGVGEQTKFIDSLLDHLDQFLDQRTLSPGPVSNLVYHCFPLRMQKLVCGCGSLTSFGGVENVTQSVSSARSARGRSS